MRSRLATLLLASTCVAKSIFTPARPPAIPLAVKSPYLNTWLAVGSEGGNGGYLAGEWPSFWNGAITGWTGLIRVDGTSFVWMGAPNTTALAVNQTSFSYTSSKSVFAMDVAGAVEMTITFLTNVAPTDMEAMSFPHTYMDVVVQSIDGRTHDVQIYTDISAEWISGNRSSVAQWEYGLIRPSATKRETDESLLARADEAQPAFTTYGTKTQYTGWTTAVAHPETALPEQTTPAAPPIPYSTPATLPPKSSSAAARAGPEVSVPSGVAYHMVYRQTQLAFSEVSDQTEYGYWYYATENTGNLTHQQDADVNARGQFLTHGFLTNVNDATFRPINDSFPVFAYSVDFGPVSAAPVSALFTMNLAQKQGIQYEGNHGTGPLPSLWNSYFANANAAVSYFYNNYASAVNASSALDSKIASDSVAAAGQDYLTLTSLAVRQAFAAVYLAGTTKQPFLFLKEISSDGNIQTVDVIYPFHTILIYLNPSLLKLMLDPLFINQEAGDWPFQFSIHDLGSSYPNATGHNDGSDEQQPLEECGDMIIMTLAYAQRTGDTAYLNQHYALLRQWNEYLIEGSLFPANQISTDDFAGSAPNLTDLALKGMIGINAMGQIANLTGNYVDGLNFTQISESYINQWYTLGTALNAKPPHNTLGYGLNNTFSLAYNLYADRELGLGFVKQAIYDQQSKYYPTIANPLGVPLQTPQTYSKSDWEMLCAAIASVSTRTLFIKRIVKFVNTTPTGGPLTDLYDTITGEHPSTVFINRPVIGAYFGLLALASAPT